MNKYTILINKTNKIDNEFYKKFELIETKNVENEIIKIEKLTYNQYLKLKQEIEEKENIEIGILNSYRNFKEQEEICKEYVKNYGSKEAYKLAAIPGTSEHHTGLAIDITIRTETGKFAITNEELYNENERFLKIHKYLYKYGFILRYLANKTDITKYNYEPWHIRYIGNEIAKKCYEENIVLEEYYENIGKKYLQK